MPRAYSAPDVALRIMFNKDKEAAALRAYGGTRQAVAALHAELDAADACLWLLSRPRSELSELSLGLLQYLHYMVYTATQTNGLTIAQQRARMVYIYIYGGVYDPG